MSLEIHDGRFTRSTRTTADDPLGGECDVGSVSLSARRAILSCRVMHIKTCPYSSDTSRRCILEQHMQRSSLESRCRTWWPADSEVPRLFEGRQCRFTESQHWNLALAFTRFLGDNRTLNSMFIPINMHYLSSVRCYLW
jgi:hypothetical protein